MVLAAHPFDLEKAAFLKIADDSLNRSFRDPDIQCNVSQDEVRIRVEHGEDVGVIGEERPFRRVLGLDSTAILGDWLW